MSLRSSLKSLIRRDAERPSLRERAAELRASIPASKPSAPEPTHADQVAQAGLSGGVLAVSGIDHRDGTVSYADATGKVSRRPMAQWVGFNAMQMHSHVQGEIGRRRVIEANHLPGDEHEIWEAKIRRELRSDAVLALAFNPERAFKAAQDLRSGAEPMTAEVRASCDAELITLSPQWQAAQDIYALRMQEQRTVEDAAEGSPGKAPEGHAEWQTWFQRCQEWRERTGIDAAEEASGDALYALARIEDRIAGLPAASLAGLRLKARVGQRCDDIDVTWPEGLGTGLARDILAFTEAQAAPPKPAISTSLVEQIDFAAASLEELQSLHDLADRVGTFAYALVWTSRCHVRNWGEQDCPGDRYNAAGKLMQWLGDALTDVETAANREAKRRQPNTSCDRETRLEMMALPIIQNGDPDQTEAFARELLAHAEAERTGR